MKWIGLTVLALVAILLIQLAAIELLTQAIDISINIWE